MNQEVYIDENSDAPLFALMTGEQSLREHVPGIKGGDYGSEQYKFRNSWSNSSVISGSCNI